MGRKCCVTGCRSGYDAGDKTPVFRLPPDKQERSRWLQAIPRDNIADRPDTVVCERHWPQDYDKVLFYGRYRPAFPPSVFMCVPKSLIPTTSSIPRPTKKALLSQRVVVVDELNKFTEQDKLPVDTNDLVKALNKYSFPVPTISLESDGFVIIQSKTYVSGVPLFAVKLLKDFHYECFHLGIRISVSSLAANKIYTLDRWSRIAEAVNYLIIVEGSHTTKVLSDYRNSITAAHSVGKPVYSVEALVRAFSYFSSSRATYENCYEQVEYSFWRQVLLNKKPNDRQCLTLL
ncbi:uncharacterized protein LOC144744898 [Ciona intestinalis]